MLDYTVTVSVGLPDQITRAAALAVADAEHLFPNQMRAVQELAEAGYRKWRAYATGQEALPDGSTLRARSGDYARSIKLEQEGEHEYRIWSDGTIAPHNVNIEEGSSAWNMRDVLQTSRKARRSKRGDLYLIIPFRWGTPDTIVVGEYTGREMETEIYQAMRAKAASRITGTRLEPAVNYPGEEVERFTYRWGDRLTMTELVELGFDPEDRQTQRMEGMVRMEGSTPRATSSTYLTFRTVSERSPAGSWEMPAREGKYPARAVFNWLQEKYPEIMEVALELDAQRIKQLAGIG